MFRSVRTWLTCAVLAAGSAAAAEQQGHLGKGDPKLPEGQYYDVWTVDVPAGRAVAFLIKTGDIAPFLMIYDEAGELHYDTQGVWGPAGYQLGGTFAVPHGGTWSLIVTASYPDEIDYTISYEVVDAPAQ